MGDIHVVGGGRQILELLAGEDIDGDQVDLGVTVLAGLGGGHVDDLAGAALDHDVTVLAQSRALHGVGRRRTGVGGLEGVLMLSKVLVDAISRWWLVCVAKGRGVCMLHWEKRGGSRCGASEQPSRAIWEGDRRAAQKASFSGE